MKAITEATPVSIGLIIALAGGIPYITAVYAKVDSVADRAEIVTKQVEKIEKKQDTYIETVQSIDRRLAVLEAEMKRLNTRR